MSVTWTTSRSRRCYLLLLPRPRPRGSIPPASTFQGGDLPGTFVSRGFGARSVRARNVSVSRAPEGDSAPVLRRSGSTRAVRRLTRPVRSLTRFGPLLVVAAIWRGVALWVRAPIRPFGSSLPAITARATGAAIAAVPFLLESRLRWCRSKRPRARACQRKTGNEEPRRRCAPRRFPLTPACGRRPRPPSGGM